MNKRSVAVGSSRYGLGVSSPGITAVGALAFGPDGVLFIADNAAAKIFAVDLGEAEPATEARSINVDRLDTLLAAHLGIAREDVLIRDMAVRQPSQEVYLSVMRGSGAEAIPLLIRIAADGSLSEVPLEGLPFASTPIEDAPAPDDARTEVRLVRGDREGEEIETHGRRIRIARDPLRTVTVTDMSYVDGALIVAGASNEEFSSTLRRIPFPFGGPTAASSLEIFHVSHGRYETASPIRTFVPYAGNTSILASYTCTPLVHFTLSDIASAKQLKGSTVAELGSVNTPIDIVSYARDGEEYLLVSNTNHPLIKIACKDIDRRQSLTEPHEPVGVPREALPHEGVGRMANLNGSAVLMMQHDAAGNIDLRSYSCATL